MRRLPAGLALSFVAHAALVLGLLALLDRTTPRLLFVDLVHGFRLASADGSGGGGSSGEPGPRERPAPRATPAAARPALPPRPRPVAPAAPVAPPASARVAAPAPEPPAVATAPEVIIIEPAAPQPAPTPPAVSAPAPSVTSSAPAESPGSGVSDATARASGSADGVASDAGGRESGARTGRGGSGSGGGFGAGIGARQGSTVALAVPGDGGGVPPEYEGYYQLLRARVQQTARYPGVARRRSLTGTVQLELEVAPSGELGSVVLVVSSSHALLDQEALDAVRRLGRVPFPAGMPPRRLHVRLPVDFVLRAEP